MKKTLVYFLLWRIALIVVFFIIPASLTLQKNLIGGGLEVYKTNPLFWHLSNFDGEHYLSIAKSGYHPLEYFFFPLYPLIIQILNRVAGVSFPLGGIVVSILSFIGALYFLRKLLLIDFSQKIVDRALILLLLFPTSFYFAAVYTESLFLFLTVSAFYFARKRHWLLSGLFSFLSGIARVIGAFVALSVLFDYLEKRITIKNRFAVRLNISVIPVLLGGLGLPVYMLYLQNKAHDFLAFEHNLAIYGEQRSSTLILLPQVFFRYVFRILPTIGSYWQMDIVYLLEFIVACLFLLLILWGYKKIRISYFLYLFFGYVIPTLSGSFSSLPRYVLVLFPGFVLMSMFLEKLPKLTRFILYFLCFMALIVYYALFVRGYWVA